MHVGWGVSPHLIINIPNCNNLFTWHIGCVVVTNDPFLPQPAVESKFDNFYTQHSPALNSTLTSIYQPTSNYTIYKRGRHNKNLVISLWQCSGPKRMSSSLPLISCNAAFREGREGGREANRGLRGCVENVGDRGR